MPCGLQSRQAALVQILTSEHPVDLKFQIGKIYYEHKNENERTKNVSERFVNKIHAILMNSLRRICFCVFNFNFFDS